MEVFIENLRDLIVEHNKSLRQLAVDSGVPAMQFSRYLNGSIPTIETTLKIAKYFECLLDYLFGLSSNKETNKYKTYGYDISKFLANYDKLLKQNNTTHYKFMKVSRYNESVI